MNKPSGGAVEIGRLCSKASRPQNAIYPGLLTALAAHISGASYSVAGTGYVLILLVYALATGFNNMYDIATDSANGRTDNPLVGGQISLKSLKVFFAVCVLTIITLQTVFSQPWTVILVIFYGGLLLGYSHPQFRIMSRGLWATFLLAVCYGSLPLLLGAVQGGRINGMVAVDVALLQAGLLFPVLLAKDYKDLKGDAATGKYTPLVRYGPKAVMWLSYAISLAVSITYLFLLAAKGCNVIRAVVLSITYVVLVLMLHSRQPRPPKSIRLSLTVVMLAMTLLVLKCYTGMV